MVAASSQLFRSKRCEEATRKSGVSEVFRGCHENVSDFQTIPTSQDMFVRPSVTLVNCNHILQQIK